MSEKTGSSEGPLLRRRGFLALAGAAGAATGALWFLGRPADRELRRLYAALTPELERKLGKEEWFATACGECPGGCSVLVRLMEGRAKKIEGNPVFPVNRGRHCARAEASLQGLYSPDRIQRPYRRGPGGHLDAVSWDDILRTVAEHLGQLKDQGRADRVLVVSRPVRGSLRQIINRFSRTFGASAPIFWSVFDENVMRRSVLDILASDVLPHWDLAHADLVVSFGANFLEHWLAPVAFSRAYGTFRQGAADGPEGRAVGRGAHVQIEPRLSLTGASADLWIPARPGSEGRLAQVLAAELLQRSALPETDRQRWRQWMGTATIEDAAAACDVPGEMVERLLGLVRTARRPLFLGGGGVGASADGYGTLCRVQALNVLAGALHSVGGVLPNPAPLLDDLDGFGPEDTGVRTSAAPAGFAQLEALGERILAGTSSLEVLIVYDVDLLHQLPRASAFRRSLARIPMIISLASFPDETSASAHLLLPAHTPLESWSLTVPDPAPGERVLTLAQPVVSPQHDTLHPGTIFLRLAAELGPRMDEAFPSSSFEDLMRDGLASLYAGNRPRLGAVTREEFVAGLTERGGWFAAPEVAGWTDPPPAPPATLASRVPADGRAFSPPVTPGTADPDRYPYYLLPYPSSLLGSGEGANRPWLQQAGDPMTTVAWNSWVELNPRTARELGVQEGDLIRVESRHGAILLPAYLYEGVRPDTVAVPAGQGHEESGRYARGRGANPLAILEPAVEPSTGQLMWMTTRVSITPTGDSVRLAKLEGPDGGERSGRS